MGEARERVDLIHELTELGGSEELLDGSHDRANVDERLRGDGLDVLGGHALTHDTLHTRQANAHLVLNQFANAANAAVCEVILIVEAVAGLALCEMQEVGAGGENLGLGEN